MKENLYDDKELKPILEQMTDDNWNKLYFDDKYKVFLSFIKKVNKLNNEEFESIIKVDQIFEKRSFFFNDDRKIFVSEQAFNERNDKVNLIYSYFFQYKFDEIYNETFKKMNINFSELTTKEQLYRKNCLVSMIGKWSNICDSDDPNYIFQPIGKASCDYALENTNKILKIMIKEFGIDESMEDFLAITTFQKYDEKKAAEYEDMLDKNMEKRKEEEEIAIKVSNMFNRGLSNLSDNEVFFLSRKEFYFLFKSNESVMIANELIKRVCKSESILKSEVTLDEKGFYNFDGEKYHHNQWSLYNIDLIVNFIVKNELDDISIIRKEVKDTEFLSDLELNLYKNEKNEYVNIFDYDVDPQKYYTQPLIIYKSKKIKKIKDKIYDGMNQQSNNLDFISKSDNEIIENLCIKKAELLANKPFAQLYKDLIQEMKQRVVKEEGNIKKEGR